MIFSKGINPNCSECAFVIYKSRLTNKQKDFVDKFVEEKGFTLTFTPQGNISIESGVDNNPEDKTELYHLKETFETLSNWLKLGMKEGYDKDYILYRDDSYYDMIDEGHL